MFNQKYNEGLRGTKGILFRITPIKSWDRHSKVYKEDIPRYNRADRQRYLNIFLEFLPSLVFIIGLISVMFYCFYCMF